ncbi:hypothetical protein PFISCL1PPCAC_2669, partial [Pristionchus fissidentatus]
AGCSHVGIAEEARERRGTAGMASDAVEGAATRFRVDRQGRPPRCSLLGTPDLLPLLGRRLRRDSTLGHSRHCSLRRHLDHGRTALRRQLPEGRRGGVGRLLGTRQGGIRHCFRDVPRLLDRHLLCSPFLERRHQVR